MAALTPGGPDWRPDGGPRHRRGRVHRECLRGAARRGRGGRGGARRPVLRPSGGGASRGVVLRGADRGPGARGSHRRRAPPRRLCPFRGVCLRGRVGDRAGALLRQQLHPGPDPLRVAGGGRGEAGRLLLDLRDLRGAAGGADPREPPPVAHQPLRLVEALRGAGAPRLRSGLRAEVRGPALLQRGGGDSGAGGAPRPRDPPDPPGPGGGRRATREALGLRDRLPHPGRDRGARLHPHRGPGGGPPAGPRSPPRRRGLRVPEPRERDRVLGAGGHRDREEGQRSRRALRERPPTRGRSPPPGGERATRPGRPGLGAEATGPRGDRPLGLGVAEGPPRRVRAPRE